MLTMRCWINKFILIKLAFLQMFLHLNNFVPIVTCDQFLKLVTMFLIVLSLFRDFIAFVSKSILGTVFNILNVGLKGLEVFIIHVSRRIHFSKAFRLINLQFYLLTLEIFLPSQRKSSYHNPRRFYVLSGFDFE